MKKLLNSKWTSLINIEGWKHYQVRNVLIKKKQVEIYAVCDKKISFVIDINDLKDKTKWIAGWKD